MPKIPNVSGFSEKAATEQLTAAGFKVEKREAASDIIAKGNAIKTTPAAEDDAAAGSTVVLFVAAGVVPAPGAGGGGGGGAAPGGGAAGGAGGGPAGAGGGAAGGGGGGAAGGAGGGGAAAGGGAGGGGAGGGPTPAGMVTVPDISGLTVPASKRVLEAVGLKQGKSTNQYSDVMPKGAVLSSIPATGDAVTLGTTVNVEVSQGPDPSWIEQIAPTILTAIGLIVVVAILYALFDKEGILTDLADKEVARGLITFLIAISTVGIAIILAISTVVSAQTPDDDKRFDRGKQVLTILIGVLGTIVGFYFGAADTPQRQRQEQSQTDTNVLAMPAGKVNTAYPKKEVISTEGLTKPIDWSRSEKLPTGLKMNDAGELEGTPTAPFKKATIKVIGEDKSTPKKTVEKSIELEVVQ